MARSRRTRTGWRWPSAPLPLALLGLEQDHEQDVPSQQTTLESCADGEAARVVVVEEEEAAAAATAVGGCELEPEVAVAVGAWVGAEVEPVV
eukprot:2787384-Prymnesium_polylepis.1